MTGELGAGPFQGGCEVMVQRSSDRVAFRARVFGTVSTVYLPQGMIPVVAVDDNAAYPRGVIRFYPAGSMRSPRPQERWHIDDRVVGAVSPDGLDLVQFGATVVAVADDGTVTVAPDPGTQMVGLWTFAADELLREEVTRGVTRAGSGVAVPGEDGGAVPASGQRVPAGGGSAPVGADVAPAVPHVPPAPWEVPDVTYRGVTFRVGDRVMWIATDEVTGLDGPAGPLRRWGTILRLHAPPASSSYAIVLPSLDTDQPSADWVAVRVPDLTRETEPEPADPWQPGEPEPKEGYRCTP
jgi:hypothetical protein